MWFTRYVSTCQSISDPIRKYSLMMLLHIGMLIYWWVLEELAATVSVLPDCRQNTLISLLSVWLCEYNIQEPDHHYDNENENIYMISSHLYHHVIYVSLDDNMISLKSNTALIFQYWRKVLNGTGNHQSYKMYLTIPHTRFSIELWGLRKSRVIELSFTAPTGCSNVRLLWKGPMSDELTQLRMKRLGSIGHISSTNEGLKFTISKLYFIICDSFSVHLLQSYNNIDIFTHWIATDVLMRLFGLFDEWMISNLLNQVIAKMHLWEVYATCKIEHNFTVSTVRMHKMSLSTYCVRFTW